MVREGSQSRAVADLAEGLILASVEIEASPERVFEAFDGGCQSLYVGPQRPPRLFVKNGRSSGRRPPVRCGPSRATRRESR